MKYLNLAVILFTSQLLPSNSAASQLYLKPGDSGQFAFTVNNTTDSLSALPAPRVEYPNQPDWFTWNVDGFESYGSILPGTSSQITVDFSIANDAPSITTSLEFRLTFSTSSVYPPIWYPAENQTIVVDKTAPGISIAQDAWKIYSPSSGYIIDGASISVRGPQMNFSAYDAESGVADFQILNSSGDNLSADYYKLSFTTATYSVQLPEGVYSITAINNSGSVTSGTINVDYTPNIIMDSCASVGSEVPYSVTCNVSITSVWGLTALRVSRSNSDPLNVAALTALSPDKEYSLLGSTVAHVSISSLSSGKYYLYAQDSLGMISAVPVILVSSTVLDTASGQYSNVIDYAYSGSTASNNTDISVGTDDGTAITFSITCDTVPMIGATTINTYPIPTPDTLYGFTYPYNTGFNINSESACLGVANLEVKYSPEILSAAQEGGAKLYASSNSLSWSDITLSASPGFIAGRTSGLNKLLLVFPHTSTAPYISQSDVSVGQYPAVQVTAYSTTTVYAVPSASAPVKGLLDSAQSSGKYLLGSVYRLSNSGENLLPPGMLSVAVSTSYLRTVGVPVSTLSVLCSYGAAFTALSGETIFESSISASLAKLPDYCGLFSGVQPGIPDTISPVTNIRYYDYYSSGTKVYLGPDSFIGLLGVDDSSGTIPSSGINATYFSVLDTTSAVNEYQTGNLDSYYVYESTFNLDEGITDLSYFSEDNVGNTELLKQATFYVDYTPPNSWVDIAPWQYIADNGVLYTSGADSITISADDPEYNYVASGIGKIRYLFDVSRDSCSTASPSGNRGTCGNPEYSAPFVVGGGSRTVYYWAEDNVGNIEDENSLIIYSDTAAPQVAAYFNGKVINDNGPVILNSTDSVTLAALDPDVSGFSSGISEIDYLVDTTPETCTEAPDYSGDGGTCNNPKYEGGVVIPSGAHIIYYSAVDKVGNRSNWNKFLASNLPTLLAGDSLAPTTHLYVGSAELSSGTTGYISNIAPVVITATDALSGVAWIFYSVDSASEDNWSQYRSSFTLSPGIHAVYYGAIDNALNQSRISTVTFIVSASTSTDTMPPSVTAWDGTAKLSTSTINYVAYGDSVTLVATDEVSGVSGIYYLVDSTTAIPELYHQPFVIDVGTHTIYFVAVDNAANRSAVQELTVIAQNGYDNIVPTVVLLASSSTIVDGSSHTITTSDFLSISAVDPLHNGYASGIQSIYYLIDISPAECDNQRIQITTPGSCQNPYYNGAFSLTVGSHTIYYSAIDKAGNNAAIGTAYVAVVAAPVESWNAIIPSSGPIGVPFSIGGSGFGAYASGITTVLIGGATAPLTLWSTDTIKGTIPGSLSAGEYPVSVMRGTTTLANVSSFTVTTPALYSLTPSSGAIGIPFTLTGESFGNYVSGRTQVLLGGVTCPLTLWSDNKIQGAIPGTLAVGDYELVVERAVNGGVVRTSSATFSLRNMEAWWLAPSSGPIGMPFTITGAGFGNYSSAYTHVLVGDTTAPLTLWTDGKIQGTVPGGLSAGQYPVIVERLTADGGRLRTSSMTFEVVTVDVASMTPVAGPIGVPFTVYGAGFGNYVSGKTRVLLGDTTAPLTLWTDTRIQGTVPGSLAAGDYALVVERELNSGIARSSTFTFTVVELSVASMTPVAGPIGIPFTIYGGNFGNYSSGYTKVLLGDTTCPLTLWSDTRIQGNIPGSLADGDYAVTVVRSINGGLVQSSSMTFTVASPVAYALSPSSGPIGLPFSITGDNFGNYLSGYTRVLLGGATCPLTLWSTTTIKGTVPALAAGDYELYVERAINNGVVRSSTFSFTVADPALVSVTPATAAVVAAFTLGGYNFGNYASGYSRVLINGTTCPLTLWSDTKVQGKLPYLTAGTYPVQVQRAFNGGLAESATAYINVEEPYISSMTPVSGTAGSTYNLYGHGFGAYDSSIAKVFVGGVASALSLWTDTRITGTIPSGLSYGTYTVVAVRSQAQSDGVEYTIPGGFRLTAAGSYAPLSQEFKLGEVYVYPDPAKGGKVPTFHIEVGTADTVKIKVFTVSGDVALERTLTGNPQVTGSVYAYEYPWEGRIASGVYYYTMEAERAGKKLKARGKFAVVR